MIDNNITIFFSKDRPLQLDLALNTNAIQCVDRLNQYEVVLYKASDERFKKAYKQVSKEHGEVEFISQTDFKSDLLNLISKKDKVLFVVDDTIFTNKYYLSNLDLFMDVFQGSLGFSLRLGENTKYCYPINQANEMPKFQKLTENNRSFNWLETGIGDFSYPLELSSSLYRVEDILFILENYNYANPNTLEWIMSNQLGKFKYAPFLLCYDTSVAFSNPINKIQTENNNRSGNKEEYSIESLLEKYENGFRANPNIYDKFVSNGCHQEEALYFEVR